MHGKWNIIEFRHDSYIRGYHVYNGKDYPLDKITDYDQERPSFENHPCQPTPENGGVVWTIELAATATNSNNIFEYYEDEMAIPRSPLVNVHLSIAYI